MHKRIMAAMLSMLMVSASALYFSGCSNSEESSEAESGTTQTEEKSASKSDAVKNMENGAILQAFCWDFNTIKKSLPDIRAAGFTAVQTSPINECVVGEDGGMELYGVGKWYYHYQPTDFKIGNYQLGTRDEFKSMCEEAEKYGIKVIVDIIANHTTTDLDAVSKDLIEAGGGSLATLYHKGSSKDLTDYSDRLACTTYKMGGLPDINTERTSYQDYFLKFVNDAIDYGADGFRYDTAKHIGLPDDPKEDDGFKNNFWERVTTEIHKADDMFIYGEVLQGGGDRIADYIKAIGHTTASAYGTKVRAAVLNSTFDTNLIESYYVDDAPADVVTWVESHDNYINDGTWSQLSDEQVILGWAYITARKDGTPLFFSRPVGSTTENEWGMNRIGTQGSDMYKDERVKAVNFFRTAMVGEDEKLVNPNDDQSVIMVERGTKGAVIVNTLGDKKVDFATSLADGTYVDRVDGKTEYTVKDGKLSCKSEIKANSVVVLYNDGYSEPEKTAEVGVADDTSFQFESDSVDVKLTLKNAESATYSVNGGKAVSFKDGDKVTLKPDKNNLATLELSAKNDKGTETYERFEFTKKEHYTIKKGTKVYFETNDSADWENVNIYVYNEDENENSSWPGEAMKKESDGKYSYTFKYDWDTPYIIFNDGEESDGEQYPSGKGLKVEADKTYKAE